MDCVCGLCERDDRVLLVCNERRIDGETTRCWDLPGGQVEHGESLPQAMAREWEEETNTPATIGELLLVEDGVVRSAPDAPIARTWRTAFFAVASEGEPTPGDGIVAVEWVPRDEVIARLDAPYHAAMRAYLAGDPTRHAHVTWIDRPGPRPEGLDDDLRELLVMAAAGAMGELLLVRRHAELARQKGATEPRIAEALLQLAPYCGFPRTIGALSALSSPPFWTQPPATPADVPQDERTARGRACFDAVYGTRANRIRENLQHLHPLLQRWIETFAYGRVLTREGPLSLLQRELLAVAILTAMGMQEVALFGHMRAAKELGATAGQIAVAVGAVPLVSNDGREISARALLAKL